jgi:hypothetical protein
VDRIFLEAGWLIVTEARDPRDEATKLEELTYAAALQRGAAVRNKSGCWSPRTFVLISSLPIERLRLRVVRRRLVQPRQVVEACGIVWVCLALGILQDPQDLPIEGFGLC